MLRDNTGRGQLAYQIFIAVFLVSGVSSVLNVVYSIVVGNEEYSSTAEVFDTLMSLLPIAELGLILMSAIVFIRWLRRAYCNLAAAGIPIEHQESWAAGAWFVPFISMYRPYSITREIWKGSQSLAGEVLKPHGLLRIWWILFLIRGFSGFIVSAVAQGASSVSKLQEALLVSAGANVLDAVAAGVTLLVIRRIMEFEQQLQLRSQVASIGQLPVDAPELLPTEPDAYF